MRKPGSKPKNNRLTYTNSNQIYFDIDEIKCRHPKLYKSVVGYIDFPARMDLVDRILLSHDELNLNEMPGRLDADELGVKEAEVVRMAKELFIDGLDITFDYSTIDHIEDDVQLNRDLEELYFDAEDTE